MQARYQEAQFFNLLPFLDSEVLRIYPCGVPAPSVFQKATEVISTNAADSYGRQIVPISRLHLKEDWALVQAATQYLLAAASSLSGSPGWDPGQAPPPLPGGRRLLMALPRSRFIKDLFCGVAIKINRRPESQGTKNQLRRNREGKGVGVGGKRDLGLPKTRFPWQPASKIVWEWKIMKTTGESKAILARESRPQDWLNPPAHSSQRAPGDLVTCPTPHSISFSKVVNSAVPLWALCLGSSAKKPHSTPTLWVAGETRET